MEEVEDVTSPARNAGEDASGGEMKMNTKQKIGAAVAGAGLLGAGVLGVAGVLTTAKAYI